MTDINLYQTMFEKYIDGIIDEPHFDNFVESLSSPTFLGCRIDLSRGKADKKINKNKEIVDNTNRAISIFNSSIAMRKKLDDELFDLIKKIINLNDDMSHKDSWKFIKIKAIDGSIKGDRIASFTCCGVPTNTFYKEFKKNNKDTSKIDKVNIIMKLNIPLVSDEITDTFLNNEFCSLSIKRTKK